MRPNLPSGTVTFLFTDVEGSTKILRELGPDAYAAALAEHRRILREAFAAHRGVEVDTQGDAFFVAFADAVDAVQAAEQAFEQLADGRIQVRAGIHTGTPRVAEEGYIGMDVHRAARIAAAGHGGQVLVSGATAASVHRDRLRDLGEHRLKDFDEPTLIYQLGDANFPPLKTISNTNLPRPASSFVGRQSEVREVVEVIGEGARLLSLTGPGGSGKTRLALEAAAELVPRFKAGVFWIGLASLRDPKLVMDTVSQAVGAKDALATHIADREMLLLLDNLEQVIDAAPELAALVEMCPNLTLLVTSRERLRVRGEVEYSVLPLADLDAVELFCARAGTEANATVAELCRALDNLPLALELAAARTNLLAPEQILERLSGRLDLLKGGRDADPRQQTLRATIAWSHDLLGANEQRLFRRLGVFAGCTIESAEAVADADLDTLQSLVDKSLLRRTGDRFWMLETIREYAVERLGASSEAGKMRHRHANWFLALAEAAEPHLRTSNAKLWLGRLEADHDNLRLAVGSGEDAGRTQFVLRLVGALWRLWYQRGHLAEGLRRVEDALAADALPTSARAKALNGAAVLAYVNGDPVSTRMRADEALELHRTLGDTWGAGYAEFMLGTVASDEGDPQRARRLLEESVARFRDLGDDYLILAAAHGLAQVLADLGETGAAETLHRETLNRARQIGADSQEAYSLMELAVFALEAGRLDDARSSLRDALRILKDLGDLLGIAVTLGQLSAVDAVDGRAEMAAVLLSRADALHREIGAGVASWAARSNTKTLASVRAKLEETAFSAAWERGRSLSTEEAVALALDSQG